LGIGREYSRRYFHRESPSFAQQIAASDRAAFCPIAPKTQNADVAKTVSKVTDSHTGLLVERGVPDREVDVYGSFS
jgi:hypothetical protein